MILKEEKLYFKIYTVFEQNPNKTKIWIRDLYHKVFPTKEQYIRFIRKHHSMLQSLKKSDNIKNIEPMKSQIPTRFIMTNLNNNNLRFEKDNFWNGISSLNAKMLKLFLMEWFIKKPKNDRKLWNYYILGISEGKIAFLLNDNFYSTRKKILELKKDFLRNLITIIDIDKNSKN